MQIFCISLCVYDAILCFNRYQESELQRQLFSKSQASLGANDEKLGIADRAERVLPDSLHEILPSRTVPFFKTWL